MRIVHVTTRLLRAGSEENTISTCIAQAEEGHDVWLAHGNESHPQMKAECGASVRLVEIAELVHPLDARRDIAAVLRLRALFRHLRPDIVHTHQSKAGIIGRVAARLAGVPTIVHGVHILPFHNVGAAQKAVYLLAERSIARFTDAFIDVSEGTREVCLEHSVGRPERHFVVHSGFDVARFRDARPPDDWSRLARVGQHEPRPPIVLMLAALEERKRHLAFLEAFPAVVERVPAVRLLLAGEGPLRAGIEATIARLGLGQNVQLLGFVTDPERLIALSDVTLLTSMREGLPRVVMQSLAGGKPVIVSEVPGIRQIVADGVNGLITPADDVRAAADALAAVLCDRRRLAALQRNAASTDVSSWSVDTMCRAISDIYVRIGGSQLSSEVDEAA